MEVWFIIYNSFLVFPLRHYFLLCFLNAKPFRHDAFPLELADPDWTLWNLDQIYPSSFNLWCQAVCSQQQKNWIIQKICSREMESLFWLPLTNWSKIFCNWFMEGTWEDWEMWTGKIQEFYQKINERFWRELRRSLSCFILRCLHAPHVLSGKCFEGEWIMYPLEPKAILRGGDWLQEANHWGPDPEGWFSLPGSSLCSAS